MIKLNVGTSPICSKEGWHTLDHKTRYKTDTSIYSSLIVTQGVNEDGVLRILTPNLKRFVPNVSR
ncbi:MAG: hypothetical protein HOH13_11505 [Crocinitomicaceae bacterium]|jgi:hypothetical protein|nr:hypothetical protein [Crocinitomicaceae bacterium]